MYSAEVLSQLRTLNWLLREAQRLPKGNPQRSVLNRQADVVGERLPLSIQRYYDERAQKNLPIISELDGPDCGYCHQKLPVATLAELAWPGRFSVCPHCGVFIGSGSPDEPYERPPEEARDEQRSKKPRATHS